MERELLLLGLLRQSDMHGYKLAEFIERDLTTCTDLKKPTTYFLLSKMVKHGWISEHHEQAGNRPQRRVYRITEAGEQQFQRLLRANLTSYTSPPFASDIGLAFADTLEPEEALALLRQRRAALAETLERARATPPHAGSWQSIIDHRVAHLEHELSWLDQLLARLAQAASA